VTPDNNPNHQGGCGCVFCNRMKQKTMTIESWESHHKDHCNFGDHFATAPLEHAPDGYPAFWLICPCGAKILTDKRAD
jgi:hypothetical protein